MIQVQVPEDYRDKVREMAKAKAMNVQNFIKYLIAKEEEKNG